MRHYLKELKAKELNTVALLHGGELNHESRLKTSISSYGIPYCVRLCNHYHIYLVYKSTSV
jgi:hypothetical protein